VYTVSLSIGALRCVSDAYYAPKRAPVNTVGAGTAPETVDLGAQVEDKKTRMAMEAVATELLAQLRQCKQAKLRFVYLHSSVDSRVELVTL